MAFRFISPIIAVLALSASATALGSTSLDDFEFDDELELTVQDDENLSEDIDLSRGNSTERTSTKQRKKGDEPKPTFDFDEPEEEFDLMDDELDEPGELLGNFEDIEDEPIEDFDRPAPRQVSSPASRPGPISLDVAGRQPFADNYPLSVVAIDRDSVVVELPVLIARSRVGMESGFMIIGDVYAGDQKVAQVQQAVEPISVAEFGPSFVFLKVLAPVNERQGQIKLVIKRAELNGSNATELFTRSTPYSLQ